METILVIDDELFMRRLCEDMLSLRGFTVRTAENAREGLACVEQGGVDVVLLDVMMPELSGLEVLPLLTQADSDIVVIIMTAYASLETAIEALKRGAHDYLRKPFRPHELYHAVDKAVARRKIALENKRLREEIAFRNRALSSLYRVVKYVQSDSPLGQVLEKTVAAIAGAMEVEVVSVMLLNGAGEMTIGAAVGLPPEVVREIRQKVGTGIAGWVAENGEPLLVEDVEKDPRCGKEFSDPRYKSKSLLSVPLLSGSRAVGVLNLAAKKSGSVFTEHDLEIAGSFSGLLVTALENRERTESPTHTGSTSPLSPSAAETNKELEEYRVVKCEGCGRKFRVPQSQIPPQGVEVPCPKCQQIIPLSP